MAVWGKIIGGTTGFALGGPIGALLGAIAGHGVDKARIVNTNTGNRSFSTEDSEQVFATGVVALAAKLSKIDGVVTRDEISTFKKIFEFPNSDINIISKLFNSAKEDAYNYKSYAEQLKKHFLDKKVLTEILNALFAIAYSDKVLHPEEEKMLVQISNIFEIDKENFNRIKSIYADAQSTDQDKLQRYYNLLGASKEDSFNDIQNKYRKIIKDYHPDKIQGKGLPEDFIEFANKKLKDFNEAYNEIKKNRK